jgi:hypothetical protein
MSTPPDIQPAGNTPGKKRKLLRILAAIALALIVFFQDLLIETMPPNIKTALEEFNKKYPYLWFAVIGIIIIILVVSTIWEPGNKETGETEPVNLTDEERQRFIKLLQNRYALRMAQKTGERFALKLELRYTLNGIQQTEHLDIAARQPGRPIGGMADLVKRHRYLLLMGQPGAGKTTILLSTAEELLQQAMADKEAPIPVIFNLASWKETESSFDGWMVKILIHGYGYPPAAALEAISKGGLLLLLDGLDEVGNHLENEADKNMLRQNCLNVIQQYQLQRSSPPGIIICTRIAEYLSAGGNAPVYAQLMLQPIDKKELKACLQSIAQGEGQLVDKEHPYQAANRAAATNLLQLTANSANLNELLCTPFYFNAALRVLNKPGDGSIRFVHDKEHTRHKLEAIYINRSLAGSRHKAYSPEKLRRWLSWLAHWQQQRSSASFELSSFGPGSLQLTTKQVKEHSWTLGLFLALGGCIISVWPFDWVRFLVISLILLGVGFLTIYAGIEENKLSTIVTFDTAILNIKVKKIKFRKICTDLFTYSIIGLILGLFDKFKNLFEVMCIAVLCGLFFSSVPEVFTLSFRIAYFVEVNRPKHRLHAGLKFLCLLFATGIIGSFTFQFIEELHDFIKKGTMAITFVLGIIFIVRLLPLLQFISTQLTLSRLGHLPLRMAHFFDYCANELHLLEKDTGGSWRFRHQIIQDYFANQYRSRQV